MMRRPRESAVIVPIALPAALERLRRAWVPVATLGVPAHVTLLYPFIEPRRLTTADLARLAEAVAAEPTFDFELRSVMAFPAGEGSPGTTYLAPEPAATFVRLTARIWAAFPNHPPYGGAHAEVIPHLTVADDAGRREAIAAAASRLVPIHARVSEAWLIVEGADDRWTRRATLPLG